MKEKLKSRNGITLIALIITIIILLILAMVTINILINQGIIGHANNAVRGYEITEEKELISLAYKNYKMDKLHNADAQLMVDGANGGNPIPKENGVWNIKFDKTGHTYELKENGAYVEPCVDNGDGTYTLGDTTVKVGDYIGYDAKVDADGNSVATTSYTSYSYRNEDKNEGRTNGCDSDQTFDVNSYEGGWRVLGVQDGKLKLISSSSVGKLQFQGASAYVYGRDELDAISAIYGQGKGASGARSINVDDVNSITGYNPEKPGDGKAYGDGTLYQYGNDVTYYWQGSSQPFYSGTNGITGTLSGSHYGFVWCDENGEHYSPQSKTAKASAKEKITTLTSTYYQYYPNTLTSSSSGDVKGIEISSNEYKVLFGQTYWLASRATQCYTRYTWFGVRFVSGETKYSNGQVTFSQFSSNEGAKSYSRGVRPVVTLSSDIQIKSDASHDGSTQAKAFILQ